MKYRVGVILILLVILGAGTYWYATRPLPTKDQIAILPRGTTEPPTLDETATQLTNLEQPSTPTNPNTPPYTGTVLAGTTAPLLDFTQADFETAHAADKIVVLYFYANWCPICREEFPKMQSAFNSLSSDQVVGFRVNFNDNETDSDERALAREHGVAYQHTKIILRHDTQLLKSPETWETDRYARELHNLLGTP